MDESEETTNGEVQRLRRENHDLRTDLKEIGTKYGRELEAYQQALLEKDNEVEDLQKEVSDKKLELDSLWNELDDLNRHPGISQREAEVSSKRHEEQLRALHEEIEKKNSTIVMLSKNMH